MSECGWPAIPVPDGWAFAGEGHDEQRELFFIEGANCMHPCDCADRAAGAS